MQTSRTILIRQSAKMRAVKAATLTIMLLFCSSSTAAVTDQDELDFIAAQIQRAEADQARDSLLQIIEQIERNQGRYAVELVQPLTLLGDAHSTLGQPRAAADSYDRALHLNRSNLGLFDASQTEIVYRQARTALSQGDLLTAQQREEYAYEVLSRHYGSNSSELLPAISRLARFYQRGYNFLAARVLFKRALGILAANGEQESATAVPFLQGIAKSYLTEGFPPFRYSPSQMDTRPQMGMREQDLFREVGSINNFPAGERALQQVVEIQQRALDTAMLEPETTAEKLARLNNASNLALLDLADWHQMFGHIRESKSLYKHLYQQTHKDLEQPTMAFEQPKLLYLPKPKNPKRPDGSVREPANGWVEIQFDVLPNGRIRNLETLASVPQGLMDFQVRRNLRDAIFRPAVSTDGPVISEAYVYRHDFKHYPKQELSNAAANATATQDQ
jgi:tetratricopeptide (TPR) repeat protein